MNYGRKHGLKLDEIDFETIIVDKFKGNKDFPTAKPAQGEYIHGVYIEGGSWSNSQHKLVDQPPFELF